MPPPTIVVVGGNGFLGSAICRTAVSRSWTVHSLSSSGRPYATPSGHTPRWAQSVTWHAADAFQPAAYAPLLAGADAVVHTLGILLEDPGYKGAVKEGDVWSLARAFWGGLAGTGGATNPLRSAEDKRGGYEGMNRDSAIAVLNTYIDALPPSTPNHAPSSSAPSSSDASRPTRPFVYISAADAFRPLVPPAYLETKRAAELLIARAAADHPAAAIRPVFVRPGLMYHPHVRPLSTLPAFGLSLSAALADRTRIFQPNPFASRSPIHGALEALRTHPLHVDHVAEAVIRSIEDEGKEGVVDVQTIRRWAGFKVKEEAAEREAERHRQEHTL